MEINETDNYFLKVFCNVDFEYVFIIKCMCLINFASKIDKINNLALKLHSKFVEPIFNIVKDRTKQHTSDDIYFDAFYCDFSKDKRLKIKKTINNNINIFETVFTPMHKIIDQVKYYYCMCNCLCNCEKRCKCHYDVYFAKLNTFYAALYVYIIP